TRMSDKAIKRARDEYIPLRMALYKNSTAPERQIDVDFIWYLDTDHPTESGECIQRTYFDWDSASIKCIFDAIANEGEEVSRKIRELTELRIVGNESKKLVASGPLEITPADPINYHEAGKKLEAKLQSDKEFRDSLYGLLGVRRRH